MDKVALITGISTGFGKATSEILSVKGYRVYGISRNQNEDLASTIKVLKADVTDVDSVRKAVDTVVAKEGRIDILVNNAGMGISGSVEDSSTADIRLQMETNFIGYINMIQAVLPVLRRNNGATIVNISSIGGIMGLPYQGIYSASKYAVEGMSDALRMELRPFKINVIVIRPGDFFTNFTASRKKTGSEGAASSVYTNQFSKTLRVIENDEKNGFPPEFLARKLSKILATKNPCQSYSIASVEQKFAVLLKRILPGKLFSKIISSHYAIKP